MTTTQPTTPPADAAGIVHVPDYRSEGYFDKLRWIDLAAPLGLADTASRQEIAAALKATLERACLCLSADSLRARALLVGAGVVIAEGEPTGMARAIRAARLERQPRLQHLAAASGDTTAPINSADFLTTIGVQVPPGKSGAEQWALMVAQFGKAGHTIGVNDLAGLLHHHTGDLSREAVLARLEEVASQAHMDLKMLSAASSKPGADLAGRLVVLGVETLQRRELTGIARAIAANAAAITRR